MRDMWFYKFKVHYWDDYEQEENIETGIVCATTFTEALGKLADCLEENNLIDVRIVIMDGTEGGIYFFKKGE